MPDKLALPSIITLTEYMGNFPKYFEAVYQIFKNDFVDSKPNFQGTKLGLKKYPLVDGKEYTFYHMTHNGDVETSREPDLRRMERISYPKPMINNSTNSSLKVWKNKRKGKDRILIFHEAENYLVVLADRGNYILPWTAYYSEHENWKRKLLSEYEEYLKAKTA